MKPSRPLDNIMIIKHIFAGPSGPLWRALHCSSFLRCRFVPSWFVFHSCCAISCVFHSLSCVCIVFVSLAGFDHLSCVYIVLFLLRISFIFLACISNCFSCGSHFSFLYSHLVVPLALFRSSAVKLFHLRSHRIICFSLRAVYG